MKRLKILMADDERDILDTMARRVAREGFEVIQAGDGREAWEKIQSDSPDIILLDLTMPGMDGLTVLRQLRNNPPSEKWQPVIIISAHESLTDIQKGFAMEADHYITKPCHLDDVIKGIRLMSTLIPQRKMPGEEE